jgi:NAD(P)-dependent dehydrogenase (short-subunit alcohol dehydrogenase family)
MSKVFVITGGSRGIGAATAIKAADTGYDVALSYATNAAAAEKVRAAVAAKGRRCWVFRADTGKADDIDAFFAAIDREVGMIDVVFNNAGIFGVPTRFIDLPRDRVRRMFDVNTLGAFVTAQAAARRLSTRTGGRGGSLINMSSIASKLGGAMEFTDYAASKGAIDTLTIGLAKELAGEGVRVNAVRPGLIDTDIHASAGLPDRVEKLKHQIPMGRGGTADEVADVVIFLASDKASYVTGQLVDIGGGRGL